MATAVKAHNILQMKKAFLEEFRKNGNISASARLVGMDRQTHYDWLEADPDYVVSFEEAIEEAGDALEAEAYRRGVEGVEEPVGFYKGEPSAHVRRFSDTLLIVLLKMRGRFRDGMDHTGPGGGAIQLTTMTDEELMDRARQLASQMPERLLNGDSDDPTD